MSPRQQAAEESKADSAEEPRPSVFRALASSLWFPVCFVVGFMACYLVLFHAPAPHDVSVAIVGEQAAATASAAMEQQVPGGFDVVSVGSAEEAREAIMDREVVVSYDPATRQLFTASANGLALEQMLLPVFGQMAAQSGGELQEVDFAPTLAGDPMGTGLFYVVITMNLVGYITVMMLLRATTLSTWTKLGARAGMGAFASVLCCSVAVGLDVIHNNLGVLLIGFLLTQAIAWVTYGLVPWVKQFIPGVAMGLFVMLSIPSSGGAIPKEMVPGFFQALHPVMPMGNAVEAMRGLLYFDGQGTARGVAVLFAWLALGAILLGVDVLRRRRAAGSEGVQAVRQECEEEPGVVVDPTFEPPQFTRVSLSGAVHDRDDRPVEGAVVTVTDTAGRQLAHVSTSADGRYAVREVREQYVTVVASLRGYLPPSSRFG